jgi:hypothetical protein
VTGRASLSVTPGGDTGCSSLPGGPVRLAAFEREAAAIEADFPGWHVWRSSAGRWWAVRQGRRARHDDRADPRPLTVDADDADGLRHLLAVIQPP